MDQMRLQSWTLDERLLCKTWRYGCWYEGSRLTVGFPITTHDCPVKRPSNAFVERNLTRFNGFSMTAISHFRFGTQSACKNLYALR